MGPEETTAPVYDDSRRTVSTSVYICVDEYHRMPPLSVSELERMEHEFRVEQETERFFLRLRRREDRMLLRRREWTARDRRFQRSVRRGQKRGRRERRQQEETE